MGDKGHTAEICDVETGEVLNPETPVALPHHPAVSEPHHEAADPPADVRHVTGLDGKTYPVTPPKPRRTPLPDQIEACVENLKKHTVRLDGYLADDRLAPNRKKVAARNHSDLLRIIGALQRAADRLS